MPEYSSSRLDWWRPGIALAQLQAHVVEARESAKAVILEEVACRACGNRSTGSREVLSDVGTSVTTGAGDVAPPPHLEEG